MANQRPIDKAKRYEELRSMLDERRKQILAELGRRLQGTRKGVAETLQTPPEGDLDTQEDIEFALIQMRAETLNKINEALARLDEGRYGHCFECGDEIPEPRLKVLPFAARCKDCEEEREIAIQRERQLARRGGAGFLPSHTPKSR